MGALYIVLQKINLDELLKHLQGIPISFLLISFLMLHISLIISALRSRYYFAKYGIQLTRKFHIALYYVGMFFNMLLPGGIGGDGYKVYLLWKLENFSRIKGLRVMFYERANGFFALGVLGLVFFLCSSFVEVIPYGYYIEVFLLIMIAPCYFLGAYIVRDNLRTALFASAYSLFVQLFSNFLCHVFDTRARW